MTASVFELFPFTILSVTASVFIWIMSIELVMFGSIDPYSDCETSFCSNPINSPKLLFLDLVDNYH